MNPDFNIRFKSYLSTLSNQLEKTAESVNPGLEFYRSGARNTLFRLEGICRMYRKIADSKKLDKWYKVFKELEDILGSIDHNDTMAREFAQIPELKALSDKVFLERFNAEIDFLGEKLKSDNWIGGAKTKAILKDIQELNNMNSEQEREAVAEFLIDEMQKLEWQYEEGEIDLRKIEDGLHEFRRKLRWISIYATVLEGGVQLRNVPALDPNIESYCTDAIVNSPFNRFPPAIEGREPLVIQSTYFYALSWLIQYLGDLKDVGLRFGAAQELVQVSEMSEESRDAFLLQYRQKMDFNPLLVLTHAEQAIDNFLQRDLILHKIARDLKRELF